MYKKYNCLITIFLFLPFFLMAQEAKRTEYYVSEWQLRSNLLYLATATPTFGVEMRPRQNIGIICNGVYGYMVWKNKERQRRLWLIQPEVRLYFGRHNCWFVGGEFHAGSFNFKANEVGYQGDLAGGGLTFGYYLYLSGKFNLDFSLGLGSTTAKYESYTRSNGYMVRRESNLSRSVLTPTQLGIALIYKL